MGEAINVLICDDDVIWVKNLANWLNDKGGFAITTTSRVDESLEILRFNNGKLLNEQFAVAVIDLDFSNHENADMAGFEILDEALSNWFLEAIVCTGKGDETKACQAIREGACQYVQKAESEHTELFLAIKAAIASRSAVVQLSEAIESLQLEMPDNHRVIALARKVFDYILTSRRRKFNHSR